MFDIIADTLLDTIKLVPFLFLTYLAKMSFAEEVFKRAEDTPQACRFIPQKTAQSNKQNRLFN